MGLLKAMYMPRRGVAAPIITSVDVFPVPAPATKARSCPAAKLSRAAACSSVAFTATASSLSASLHSVCQSASAGPAFGW
jgi:hypothetical protein